MLKKLKSLLLLSYSFFCHVFVSCCRGFGCFAVLPWLSFSAVIPVDLAVTLFYFHASFVVAVKPVGH